MLQRALVLELPARELVEVSDLPEHRPDERHLEEHPLDRLPAARRIGRDEAAGLLGEVEQDRARFEQRERLAARPVGIDDRRNLAVGIERQEFRRALLALADVDRMRLVRPARSPRA